MANKVGVNEPCPCGSTKKYKKCYLAKSEDCSLYVEERNKAMEDPDLTDQIGVLRIAHAIGEQQIQQLKTELDSKKYDTRLLDDKKVVLRTEGFYLYSKNFWGQYKFLCEKIESEKNDDMHFYIPSLRILSEFYAESLFFLNQDTRTTVGILVGTYLIHHSDNYNHLVEEPKIIDEYSRYLALAKDVLDSESIVFPTDITKLSHKYLKANGFAIPRYEEIFKKTYFTDLSQETFAHWQHDDSTNFYDKYYRVHSHYTHRNFTNQTEANIGTEVFWVVQFMVLIAQLMLELSNLKFFNDSYKPEYLDFSAKAQPSMIELKKIWEKKKPSTKN